LAQTVEAEENKEQPINEAARKEYGYFVGNKATNQQIKNAIKQNVSN